MYRLKYLEDKLAQLGDTQIDSFSSPRKRARVDPNKPIKVNPSLPPLYNPTLPPSLPPGIKTPGDSAGIQDRIAQLKATLLQKKAEAQI
jgi:hypothetical protein